MASPEGRKLGGEWLIYLDFSNGITAEVTTLGTREKTHVRNVRLRQKCQEHELPHEVAFFRAYPAILDVDSDWKKSEHNKSYRWWGK